MRDRIASERRRFTSTLPDFFSGGPDFLSGCPNFLSGGPDFLSGRPDFLSGSPNFLSGCPNFLSGSPDFLSGRRNSVGREIGPCSRRLPGRLRPGTITGGAIRYSLWKRVAGFFRASGEIFLAKTYSIGQEGMRESISPIRRMVSLRATTILW